MGEEGTKRENTKPQTKEEDVKMGGKRAVREYRGSTGRGFDMKRKPGDKTGQ